MLFVTYDSRLKLFSGPKGNKAKCFFKEFEAGIIGLEETSERRDITIKYQMAFNVVVYDYLLNDNINVVKRFKEYYRTIKNVKL